MTSGTPNPRLLFFCAGEPSGDTHAARVIQALRKRDSSLQVRGLGGPRMEAAGMELIEDLATEAIMGIFPVIKAFPRIRRSFYDTLRSLAAEPPAALILVDYPGFNMRLAARASQMGIPIIYYISPQVWAWARWRIKRLARTVDLMLVILPFEEDLYRASGLPARYVGHPLLDHLALSQPEPGRVQALREGSSPLVGIFPGSRRHVIESLLPVFMETAQRLRRHPGMEETRFVIALSQERFRQEVESAIPEGLPCTALSASSAEVMAASDLCLSSSGTTTLEIAGSGTPFVIGYRVSFIFYLIARLLIAVPFIGLVNLVAGRLVVPEFVGFRSFAAPAAEALRQLWCDPAKRHTQEEGLAEVKAKLGEHGSYERAAEEIDRFIADRDPERSS